MAEYDFTFGGAQRLLSIIAKRMSKPIYVLSEHAQRMPVWDIEPIRGIPETDIIFSPVVDKYEFQIIPAKHQIKFCHSGLSLKNFINNADAKKTKWLTHRHRVCQFWKQQGFDIDLIPDGYIPYDGKKLEITNSKQDQGVFISRICPEKGPEHAIAAFEKAGIPLIIAGNNEFNDYVSQTSRLAKSRQTRFIPPDAGTGVSLKTRDEFLRASKIVVHCSSGGMHDYLEYSLLDGLLFNCIPLCITSEPEQFAIISENGFGEVVTNHDEAAQRLPKIIAEYELYLKKAQAFMLDFLKNQDRLWDRWESKLEEICSRMPR